MLKEFTVKNYKSINEEVTLSMEADIERVSEHPSHVVDVQGNSLLRVCSVYGPNGGGKSNILKALVALQRLVMFGHSGSTGYSSFAFSDNKVSEFTAFFVTPKYEIGYKVQFTALQRDLPADETINRPVIRTYFDILNENVYAYSKKSHKYVKICSRNENGIISFGDNEEDSFFKERPIGQNMSMVRFFYEIFYVHNTKAAPSLDVLFSLYNEIGNIYSLPSDKSLFRSLSFRLPDSIYLKIIEENKNTLVKLLNASDIPIKDITISKESQTVRIFFVREMNVSGKTFEKSIELNDESSGTQKLFELLIMFLRFKKQNVIFLGDDLNAFLHPKLMAAIIELFNSDPNSYSQIIFNSHDLVNMNNRVFRRDEIWFAYRDEKYQTNLVPLSNITNYKGKQIRNDASYNKQYLEGKYGADPFIQKGLNWNE